MFRKWPERAHTIVIREVEKNVAEPSETREAEQQAPARRNIRIANFASAQSPEKINQSDDRGGYQRHSEKRMCEAAVMIKSECGASKTAEDIDVGSFGRQRHRSRGQCGLAVESGAAHGGAE